MNLSDLIKKYDVPAPRYTSYPTVPYWCDNPSTEEWCASLRRYVGQPETKTAVYLHMPFCESLCIYCACNTVITKHHSREDEYVALIETELANYAREVPEMSRSALHQIHLGGGTPTFFSAKNLQRVINAIYGHLAPVSQGFEGSVEVDPRRCTRDQLRAFRNLGFSRISLGVQDFSQQVQEAVNRIQPFDLTKRVTDQARELGYTGINFDLIYGLPFQDESCVRETCSRTLELRPDRIAFYSFAHVPWVKPAQKHILDQAPTGETKRALYELGRSLLLEAGYIEIGMDHFALPTDALYKASQNGTLHRNFMGYVDQKTDVLLGLGVSSISETPDCYHQNEKNLPEYKQLVLSGKVPTMRGHKLSEEDKLRKQQILSLMTRFQTKFLNETDRSELVRSIEPMVHDGLVEVHDDGLSIPEQGKPFLRNVCMAFDARLKAKNPTARIFSHSI